MLEPGVEQRARPVADFRRQLQVLRKVEADAEHVYRRMLLLQVFQRLAQIARRYVDRHVALHPKRREKVRSLLAVSGTQIHEGGDGSEHLGHVRQLRRENRRFGTGRVILGQLGDGGRRAANPARRRGTWVLSSPSGPSSPRAVRRESPPDRRARSAAGAAYSLRSARQREPLREANPHQEVSRANAGAGRGAVTVPSASKRAQGVGQPRSWLAASQRARRSSRSRPPRCRMP